MARALGLPTLSPGTFLSACRCLPLGNSGIAGKPGYTPLSPQLPWSAIARFARTNAWLELKTQGLKAIPAQAYCPQDAHLVSGEWVGIPSNAVEGGSRGLCGRAGHLPDLLNWAVSPPEPPALYLEKRGLRGPKQTGALRWELGPDVRASVIPSVSSSCSRRQHFPALRFRAAIRVLPRLSSAPHAGVLAIHEEMLPGKALGPATPVWICRKSHGQCGHLVPKETAKDCV